MQTSIKDQRNLRIPSSITNNAKINRLIKPINDTSKSVSNKTSIVNIMMKKQSESSMADLVTIPLSKIMSDTRFRTKNEKPFLQKKDIKDTSSTFNMNEKNVKKDLITSKTTTKQETGSVSKRNEISDKQINQMIKSEKYSNKININTKLMKSTTSTQESKLKFKTQTASKTSISKNIVENIKSSPVLIQNSHSKSRSKVKNKSKKKVIATKSETFNTDKELPEKPFIVGNDRIDLADLIEASLKNIRSPRSIFNYGFSNVQQSKKTRDILDIRSKIQNIDKFKQLKPTGSSVITNNFSHKIIRDDGVLEKFLEKSESFSEASHESLMNDKRLLPEGDSKSFSFSEKYIKAREELRKSLDWKQNNSSQDRWDPYPDTSFQNKSVISSTKIDNNNEKFSLPKRPLQLPF
ncbi:PREDICTED: uncharacterized protein LOC105458091 [Wasmannia auropunctata]|uniref:uncharacterized protein LOC105458091 n=1 Tax=Wasmannia auropunctata TaxID=64793 RepID=UPI0005EFCBEA|nr:PREDICTED: uncharacterized protein LOC105458091 [Wasmannia auropunctata]